jgi:hypothetical protein
MATKRTGVKCYDKAGEDEPLFVLRAQDLSSPGVVLEWIKANIETAPHAKLRDALETALAMTAFGKMGGGGTDGTYETKRKTAD